MTQKMLRLLLLLALCCVLPSSGLAVQSRTSTITYLDSGGHQRIYCFAIGDNGHLVVNYWDGFGWHWADQGTPINTSYLESPTAIAYKDATGTQRIYVFVTGDVGNLATNYWDGIAWHWADQGKYLPFEDAITYVDAAGNRRIYVFGGAAGTGGLGVNYWDGFTWHWADLGKPNAAAVVEPSTINYLDPAGNQRIYVFAHDGHFVLDYWNGFSWSWQDHGLPIGVGWVNVPHAVTYKNTLGNQEIYAFTHGSDGHAYMNGWDGSQGGTWHWVDRGLPAGLTSISVDNAVTFLDAAGHNRIYVFGIGSNGHLLVNYWDGLSWHWADQGLPANVTSLWAASSTITYLDSAGHRRIYIFANANNGHIVVNYWDGFTWHWADQGTF